jgi:hypothetical protein
MGWDNPVPSHGTTWIFEISHGMGWDEFLGPWDFLFFVGKKMQILF